MAALGTSVLQATHYFVMSTRARPNIPLRSFAMAFIYSFLLHFNRLPHTKYSILPLQKTSYLAITILLWLVSLNQSTPGDLGCVAAIKVKLWLSKEQKSPQRLSEAEWRLN